jgi:hypothetical protein
MRYAVWVTHKDGRKEGSPRLVETTGPFQMGDKLPLANVNCWITSVDDGAWIDEAGTAYDGRAHAAAGPTPDYLIGDGTLGP